MLWRLAPRGLSLYTELADALVKLDRSAEAAVVLRKAIALDPFNSELQKTLIVRLIELKEYASARTASGELCGAFPRGLFHATNAGSRPGSGARQIIAVN